MKRSILLVAVLALFGCEKEATIVTGNKAVQEAQMVVPLVVKEEPKEEVAALCTNPKFKVGEVVTTVIGNYKGQVWKVFTNLSKEAGVCVYGVIHELENGGTSSEFQYWEFEITR